MQENAYEVFEKWLDDTLSQELPVDLKAFCFNFYDDGDNTWSVELVGCDSFDKDNADWACDEIFDNRDEPFAWEDDCGTDEILRKIRAFIARYLLEGKHAAALTAYDGLAMGFVDGDLELLYVKQ